MIIISDTGPLHYLILLGHAALLRRFYGEVFIPDAVLVELLHASTPDVVRQFIQSTPAWLKVIHCPVTDAKFDGFGAGEREALTLAALIPDAFLLCDDGAARKAAEAEKIRFSGTLGVLRDAAVDGLLDIHIEIERLRSTTNFHGSSSLYRDVCAEVERVLRQQSHD